MNIQRIDSQAFQKGPAEHFSGTVRIMDRGVTASYFYGELAPQQAK